MSCLRIAIIDDDKGVRAGLESVLTASGHAPHLFESALEFRETQDPEDFDAILLDFIMPGMNGVELLDYFKKTHVDTPVIMMSSERDVVVSHEAGELGSVAWLPKPIYARPLLNALEKAVRRRDELAQQRAKDRASKPNATPEQIQALGRLTPAEWRVLLPLVDHDLETKEIAAELGISPRTVQSHRDSIAEKLGTRSKIAMYRLLVAADKI